ARPDFAHRKFARRRHSRLRIVVRSRLGDRQCPGNETLRTPPQWPIRRASLESNREGSPCFGIIPLCQVVLTSKFLRRYPLPLHLHAVFRWCPPRTVPAPLGFSDEFESVRDLSTQPQALDGPFDPPCPVLLRRPPGAGHL